MKQGNRAIWFTMLVLFLGVLAYLGIYIYNSFNSEVVVATVYTYTAEDRTEVSGYLVRSETLVGGDSSDLMEVVLSEGEKINAGGVIAKVYSSQEEADRQKEIDSLQSQLTRLENLDSSSSLSSDSKELDQSIVSAILRLRSETLSGDGRDLSSTAENLENLVFQREYLYSGTGNLAADISSISNQISQLQSSGASEGQQVVTDVSGIYSSQLDGYETALTVDELTDLTPSKLQEWGELQKDPDEDNYIGKLITSQTWYYAAAVDEEEAGRMGDTVTLRFASDFTEEISMTVEYKSEAEGGKVAVVLSTNKYLTQTSQLRHLAADIIYDSETGLRVPLSALQVNEDGEQGVFVIVGKQMEWKPVNVIYSDSEICLVESTEEGKSKALHSGDIVIVKGKNLEDGKVIASWT